MSCSESYSFGIPGCILFKKADATILPESLSTISQREVMTRPPKDIDVLMMLRRVPMVAGEWNKIFIP